MNFPWATLPRTWCAAGLALAGAFAVAAEPAPLAVQVTELAAPIGSSASLATAPNGIVWLTWLEPSATGGAFLRCATLYPAAPGWHAPHTIAQGSDLLINAADTPSLAVESGGRLTAVWPVRVPAADQSPAKPRHEAGSAAQVSRSIDGGESWSPPAPLSRESRVNEFATVQALGDGGVLAVWLDGRGKHGDQGGQILFARIIGSSAPDWLVEAPVCDCCQTTLARFPDGTGLLAYRGRTSDEIRDIRVAHFDTGHWSAPRTLNPDGWRISGCPVNGPRLASAGGRVGAAWYTAAQGEARVLAAVSPDAGRRFLQPLRVDRGQPVGRVDAVMLADGTLLVTWLESGAEAGLWLRRITPAGDLGQAVRLAALNPARLRGFPRLALVKDYDATPAQLVVAFQGDGATAALRTLLVRLPDLSTLAGRAPCGPCDEEDAATARGFPVKGRVVSVQPGRATLTVEHEEIPGVMRAMTMEFHAAPETLAAAAPGRGLLARIERRDRAWWIFNVKWIGTAPAAN